MRQPSLFSKTALAFLVATGCSNDIQLTSTFKGYSVVDEGQTMCYFDSREKIPAGEPFETRAECMGLESQLKVGQKYNLEVRENLLIENQLLSAKRVD